MTILRTKKRVHQAHRRGIHEIRTPGPDGETLSGWTRDMLLKATTTPPVDPRVFAQLLAFRTIALNLLFKIANGQPVSPEDMQRLIDRADSDRVRRALERLAQPTGARNE